MHRLVCFAHYDSRGLVQDYVVYYLSELKKISDVIIFVSDSYIEKSEISKIKPFVSHIIAGSHGEYDFGSYKRGYLYAKENGLLASCEELIFANDSCYAPLFPFSEMFSIMSNKNLDFWGVTENNEGVKEYVEVKKHVQSYFIVFKKQVFDSQCFNDFIVKIKHEKNKEKVIANYEIGLSSLLTDNNFKYDVYCSLSKTKRNSSVLSYKDLVRENRNPFLKRNVILYRVYDIKYPFFTKYFIKKYTNYKYELIRSDRKINKYKLSFFEHTRFLLRTIRKTIISVHVKIKLIEITIFGKQYKIC